ncbi:MAG: lipid-A-disaccharide synthase [Acidobacteriota bacterium]
MLPAPNSAYSILVVAGESSGEQHAARVIEEVQRQNPELRLQWFGSGGVEMARRRVELLAEIDHLAAVGPLEALGKLGNYWKLYRRLLREVALRQTDLALLVDFPEFNLRLARRLKGLKIPVCYFIGPQIWAWRSSRVDWIRRYVDQMLVIFPFEESFYRQRGVRARFVGNPFSQLWEPHRRQPRRADAEEALIALLPGSREKEVEQIFPVLLEAARHLSGRLPCRFWVCKAPAISAADLSRVYHKWLGRGRARRGPLGEGPSESHGLRLEIRSEPALELLPRVDCAIIKSGTSTLQAMILEVPFVMVYRFSGLSYQLLRPLVKTDTYCLANLVAGKKIVPEFVQSQATGEGIADYLSQLLKTPGRLEEVKQNLRIASERLGKRKAYPETARQMMNLLLKDDRST